MEEGRRMSISSLTATIDDNIRRRQEDDPLLQNFRDIRAMDTEYQELIHHIRDETSLKEIKNSHKAQQLSSMSVCGTDWHYWTILQKPWSRWTNTE